MTRGAVSSKRGPNTTGWLGKTNAVFKDSAGLFPYENHTGCTKGPPRNPSESAPADARRERRRRPHGKTIRLNVLSSSRLITRDIATNNNNNNNHSKTVRSYLPACHSRCISQTLDTRPLRLRSYPSWGLYFFPATCNWRSAGGEPAIREREREDEEAADPDAPPIQVFLTRWPPTPAECTGPQHRCGRETTAVRWRG